ncbi:MAG: hypothetical protein GWN62_06955, partial [Aliifodinibius sp.]|nr:hypothetical protein [Fodinibius sp.]
DGNRDTFLDAINHVLNAAFETKTTSDERFRWLQWTVLGYEMFSKLEQQRAIVMRES